MARSARPATATNASATWPSRSLSDRRRSALALALALASVSTACGDDQDRAGIGEPVARIDGPDGPLYLDAGVVAQIAARDQLDPEQARARALDTLRLVAARREELASRPTAPSNPDDLDPMRRLTLERAAMVRLWLDEVFAPSHRGADIPARVIAANMADPRVSQRLFHPDVWMVCQALVMPTPPREDGRPTPVPGRDQASPDPEQAARWYAEAEQAFAPFVDRVQRLEPELLGGDCRLLGRLVGASEHALSPTMALRFEGFAFAPSTVQGFDASWLEQVATLDGPGIVGPFPTDFGLHLVLLSKIEPAQLADGSLPDDALQAARDARLREELELSWRSQELMQTLDALRARKVVRMAAELERGE